MFRARKNILDSLRLQKKCFVRNFSTPTLPEFADVVIIGKKRSKKVETREKTAEGRKNQAKL